jgi:HIV-1 Vpr-binding protein
MLEHPSAAFVWSPLVMMNSLQGFTLMLQIVALSSDWRGYSCRGDVTRLALETLFVLTVFPKAKLALCEQITLPSGESESGMRSVIMHENNA